LGADASEKYRNYDESNLVFWMKERECYFILMHVAELFSHSVLLYLAVL
jgi:hypothetical protein